MAPCFTKSKGIKMEKKDRRPKAIKTNKSRVHIQLVCIRVAISSFPAGICSDWSVPTVAIC